MATILAVHGTFAHVGSTPAAGGVIDGGRQWWQSGSSFEREIGELVEAGDGPVEVARFEWSGANSELARREAGHRLLAEMQKLEARNETYCVIGHSHGGSVISAALLEAGARRVKLDHMKRWVTVGTPFVKLAKERWLFARLDLFRKVIFVASMMLFLMFMVYLVADLAGGQPMLFGTTFPGILVAMGLAMSLPIVFFYFLLSYLDRRNLLLYSRSATRRAREAFGSRWLSLAHADDEAIQGLAFLPGAKLYFFDKSFAVPTLTFASVFALPLLYFVIVTSPNAILGIADWLKADVYAARTSPEAEKAVRDLQASIRQARKNAGFKIAAGGPDGQPLSGEERRTAWREYRRARGELAARYPDLPAAERALRFNARFFERNDKPCAGGRLCGEGRDLRINSGLLLHVVTDELTWALGAGDAESRQQRWLWSLVVPAVLVPVIAGLIAFVLMVLIRGAAIAISRGSSSLLNSMTNSEVKRAAFGNDTEGEIAVGAIDRPMWLERSPPRLPAALGKLVTDYSNGIASQSLSKFRNAIGQLASADPKHTADTAITTYFTWKELVHSSYFDVSEFRQLVAQAVSRTDGFKPSSRFKSDASYARTAQWLAEIEGTPGNPGAVADEKPGQKDAEAVAVVLASTVKADP
ncbi:MAG: hypothetical protein CTY20_13655 [Hyphomicrobium sp.]|nr:MAG: hypothetical protein CTY20_13655 [Hyphomicrobium sp.]